MCRTRPSATTRSRVWAGSPIGAASTSTRPTSRPTRWPRSESNIRRAWCRGARASRHACRSVRESRMRASRWWMLVFVVVSALAAAGLLAGGQGAPPPISFSRTLYPIFEAAQCRGCHADDGVASATRLHFPEPNASPDEIEAFGVTLVVLVDREDPARSLLLNKPTNRERHTGGVRIRPGSFDETALSEWVKYLAAVSEGKVNAARERLAAATSASARDQLLRRLTHSEYNNTVRDLLGDYSRPADRFPPEDFVNGFQNQLRTQGVPPLLAEAYSAAAEKVALHAFRAGDVNGLGPCKPA